MNGTIATQLYQRFQQFVADDLVKEAQNGSNRAHTEIYGLYSQAVFTLAHGICRNPQCAEDVLHNTFVKLMKKIKTFKFQAPFGMWLRQIAVNESLMYLRQQKKHKLAISSDEFDGFEDLAIENVEPTTRAYVDSAAQHTHQMDLDTVLAALPDHVRTILWLKEVEGYTHQEIADMMGKTPSYSKSVTARAYIFLRARVGQAKTLQ
ncbi:MAG: RNA polymerase sigma factor (sigma-70 family) [Cryomorphaceae bacterium]|jgi:RNA polymerase sigma factor (sigma-70 family)